MPIWQNNSSSTPDTDDSLVRVCMCVYVYLCVELNNHDPTEGTILNTLGVHFLIFSVLHNV